MQRYSEFLLLPSATSNSDPAWFAFPIYVRENAPFTRNDLQHFLESRKIATRTLFSGNILLHPAYERIPHRVIGDLPNTDKVMKGVFFIGTYQGITPEMVEYVLGSFDTFFSEHVQ